MKSFRFGTWFMLTKQSPLGVEAQHKLIILHKTNFNLQTIKNAKTIENDKMYLLQYQILD